MYKIVSKNLTAIKIGAILVDFGYQNSDFNARLNEDNTELLSIPSCDRYLFVATVLNIFTKDNDDMLTIDWHDVGIISFPVAQFTEDKGWNNVAIFDENSFLHLKLKQHE